MASIEELSQALVKADAAGNVNDAKAFADAIRQMQAAPTEGMPGQRQELTTGQKIYQAVRPYVISPAIETAGAIGGGLLGAGGGVFGGGPVGAAVGGVTGAGLGYAAGKEAVEAADVAMGMKAPRQGAQRITEPFANIATGAQYEMGGQMVGNVLAKGLGRVVDIFRPEVKAAKLARDALGKDMPEVLNALRSAKPNETAAQATANIVNPKWQALIQNRLKDDPAFVQKLATMNQQEGENALAQLAGGSTATAVRATAETAKNALNELTTPLRTAALDRANIGKTVADLEARAANLSAEAAAEVANVRRLVNAGNIAEAAGRLELIKKGLPTGFTRYTYPGQLAKDADRWASDAANASLNLGEGARFATAAADSLRAAGIKPLETAPLVSKIKAITSNPEFAGNDLMIGSVKTVADDIAKWTANNGVIDARALDAIRKNSVNATIQQLRPAADATTQRKLASSVLSQIKPLLDDAIEASGGTGYKTYLKEYAKGMQQISEGKLSGKALDLYKNNKDAFVSLVEGNSPAEVEKILGPGNYDIAKEVSEKTMDTLRDLAIKTIRDAKIKTQVEGGGQALEKLLKDHLSTFRLPSYITAVAATTNKGIQILENKMGKETMKTLTEAFKSGKGTEDLLSVLPTAERLRVMNLIDNPSNWRQGSLNVARAANKVMQSGKVSGGTLNLLAPSSEQNQNALAQQKAHLMEIDPVKYGVLWQKVQDYERRFDAMEAKMDKLETSMDSLIAMANQGRGGFWVGMTVVSIISSISGYFTHWISKG